MERMYISATREGEALLRDIVSCVEQLLGDEEHGSIDGWDYQLIYKGRNRIYRFRGSRGDFAVKCFGTLSWWRRAYYSWIGTSKARRSYLHSRELERRGVSTPEALGYVEEYGRLSLLRRSYYVCAWVETEGSSIHPHMGGTIALEGFLPALAKFLARVHRQGVEHLDLSPGNIIYKKGEGGSYQFYLVDINRMNFKPKALTLSQSLRNLDRLIWNPSVSTAFIRYYLLERREEIETDANDLDVVHKAGQDEYIRIITDRYNHYCDLFWERRLPKLIVRYNKRERNIPASSTIRSIRRFYLYARLWSLLPPSSFKESLYRKMRDIYVEDLSAEDIRHVLRRRYGFGYQLGTHFRRP